MRAHERRSPSDAGRGAGAAGGAVEIWLQKHQIDCEDQVCRKAAARYVEHHQRPWLNQAEIEISPFARQCLGARRIPDLKTLRRETQQWNRRMNRIRKKINWKFDRK